MQPLAATSPHEKCRVESFEIKQKEWGEIVVYEHVFTYSRVSCNVKYKFHFAKSKEELDLAAEEIIDEMLDWDGTELWARYSGRKPYEVAQKDFFAHVKRCYPSATINQ